MVIAFDPGVTTGIAVIDGNGDLVHAWAVGSVSDVEAKALLLHETYPDADVVGEAPPQWAGHYRSHTQDVEQVLKTHFPGISWVNPGQWKGHPAARVSDLRGRTQHEKDATGLARWFKSTRSTSVGRAAPSQG